MDPRMLEYYERELQHVRHMGADFARDYPAIARRLGMEGIEVADPYVERLLEGFAFLAARVHLRLDSQFPVFTQHLLEMVYPHFLCPTPSVLVVQIQPSAQGEGLAEGFPLPRGSVLRSQLGREDVTPCEYRTARHLKLFPIEIAEAEYAPYSRELSVAQGRGMPEIKAVLRLRLRTTVGLPFQRIAPDALGL
jgi:type VI secretion system protein ImpG